MASTASAPQPSSVANPDTLSLPQTLARLRDDIAAENGALAADPTPEAREFIRLRRVALTKLSEAEDVAHRSEALRKRLGDPSRPYIEPPSHRPNRTCGLRHTESHGRDPRLPPGRPHP